MCSQVMRGKYEAAFILPNGLKKILGKDGWKFKGAERIPSDFLGFLTNDLGLTLCESYLGMERYTGKNLQATIVYDSEKKIEFVAFQIYNNESSLLINAFANSNHKGNNELFFPATSRLATPRQDT